MKKLVILALLAYPCLSIAQNFKKQKTPKINIELIGGYPFAGFGTSLDFRSNSALKVYLFTSLIDSTHSRNEWIGMTKRISIDKQSSINLGLGMFTQFSRDLLFDIAPTIQYEYDITDNLALSASYMHVFPDRWKDQNIHALQIGVKYGIPTSGSKNGIAKYQKAKGTKTLSSFAFGSHYTMGGISFLIRPHFGLDLRGYTDLGYLFNVEPSIDMQCLSALYTLDVFNDISFDTYLGISTTLQSSSMFHNMFVSERMRVKLYENLWFSVELTQHSKAVIKNRMQPLVHAGFVIGL